MVAFYRAVAGPKTGEPGVSQSPDQLTGTTFETVLGTNQDAFVADWVSNVKRCALNPQPRLGAGDSASTSSVEVAHYDVALQLERRREVAVLLGEVAGAGR